MIKRILKFFIPMFLIVSVIIISMGFLRNELSPLTHIIIIVSSVLLIFISILIITKRFTTPSGKQTLIMSKGKEAYALILKVEDTGVTLSKRYYGIKLYLKITPDFGNEFECVTKGFFSRLNIPRAGDIIRVKYLPEIKDEVYIMNENDLSNSAASNISSNIQSGAFVHFTGLTDEQKILLSQVDSFNQKIISIGKEARAKVLSYKELGIKLENKHPFVELILEIFPPDGNQSWRAIAKAAIHEMSIERYQTGKEIFVKYDPNDVTKVSVYHS